MLWQMIVRVDVAAGSASLDDAENCKQFHVAASGGDTAAVAAALGAAGSGVGAPTDHVWIDIDWVRSQAAGRVAEDWAPNFDGMVGYARSKGWLNDTGNAIQAHIEWD